MKRDFRQKRPDVWDQENGESRKPDKHKTWVSKSQFNALFEEYYKVQNIMSNEEFNDFLRYLKEPLPVTFRINGSGRYAASMQQKIQDKLLKPFEEGKLSEDIIERPRTIAWYPNDLAWHLSFSRSDLRKQPELDRIHKFLVKESNYGGITRQEEVSMIPPLVLDVEPHHWVLDMCAAPGSKTFQLLEMIHQKELTTSRGLIIANDADVQRCNLLTHQTKRMFSPNLIITNMDGSQFPVLKGLGGTKLFDRILCDVPCSGDGTIRKAPDIWNKWNHFNANNLHSLQVRLALQSFRLLKKGGLMVYSTCSFNPVEDEAVIKEILRITKGGLKLIDITNRLPHLKRKQGIKRWKVYDNNKFYDNYEEAQANNSRKLDRSMFCDFEIDDPNFPLERCIRILPQQQDTGGFFVALLEKVDEVDIGQINNANKGDYSDLKQLNKDQKQKLQSVVERALQIKQDVQQQKNNHQQLEQSDPQNQVISQDINQKIKEQIPNISQLLDEANYISRQQIARIDKYYANEVEQKAQEEQLQSKVDEQISQIQKENSIYDNNTYNSLIQEPLPAEIDQIQNRNSKTRGVDPIIIYDEPQIVESIQNFYGLNNFDFYKHIVSRSTEPKPKKLFYISQTTQQLLILDKKQQIKIQSLGVKIFDRQESKDPNVITAYRICQEGLPIVLPHISKQLIHISVEQFKRLAQSGTLRFSENENVQDNNAQEKFTEPTQQDQVLNNDNIMAIDGITQQQTLNGKTVKNIQNGQQTQVQKQQSNIVEEDFDDDQVVVQVDFKNEQFPGKYARDGSASNIQQNSSNEVYVREQDTLDEIYEAKNGCCIILVKDQDLFDLGIISQLSSSEFDQSKNGMAMVCWRGRHSITVLVSKEECHQLIDKISQLQQFQKQTQNSSDMIVDK